MKKSVFLVLLSMLSVGVWAYDSGIAVQTEKGTSMQVYVNGKLYSKQTGKYVRVRSTPGLFHLQIKVLNPDNKRWYIVKKDIHVQKGFELQYKVIFGSDSKPEIKEVKRYPIYSRYFLNPSLYNRHPVS